MLANGNSGRCKCKHRVGLEAILPSNVQGSLSYQTQVACHLILSLSSILWLFLLDLIECKL